MPSYVKILAIVRLRHEFIVISAMLSICYRISPVLLGARVVRVKAGAYTFLLKSKQPVLGKDAAADTRASSVKKQQQHLPLSVCLCVSQ